ncbi:MarR family winged helix-turn-helix transcriptional regulator [Burkholderia sp. WSM2232]|uniref:MarR family winged helix-turn-helix transcriptional regulator n=1 Tax=Burkholderia sp. WSM2232 TaxID=944436 RepID=UPI00041F4DCD|nr:MarR family transcriptional regulator [Burkholderia sp. WSM2232]
MADERQAQLRRTKADNDEAMRLAESLCDVVGSLVRVVREHSGTRSTAQNETLAHLEQSGPVSISTLAGIRGVTHQTMRLIVMKLVDAGLLSSTQDAEDGRAYLVHLTSSGRAQLRKERKVRADWLTAGLLSKTSVEERRLLGDAILVLRKIARISENS